MASKGTQDLAGTTGRDTTTASPEMSYEHLLSSEKKDRMNTWMGIIPHHTEFEDASTRRQISIGVYQDWLNWSMYQAFSWLHKLDKFERRFRTAGLKYHKIPHQLRHSVNLLHGSKIDQSVLARLPQIFETDQPRGQQSFFNPWIEIYKVATETLEEINFYHPVPEKMDFLRTVNRKFELTFLKLAKPLRTLEGGLLWLEDAVAEVAERSELDVSEALTAKHCREGSLLRRWIQTFPEIGQGVVMARSQCTEYCIDRVLEIGIEDERYWSMLVLGNNPTDGPSA